MHVFSGVILAIFLILLVAAITAFEYTKNGRISTSLWSALVIAGILLLIAVVLIVLQTNRVIKIQECSSPIVNESKYHYPETISYC